MFESTTPTDPLPPNGFENPSPERPALAAVTEAVLEAETPGGRTAAKHDPYAALRYRDYQLYSIGWVLSVIGQQILDATVGWDIFKRTRDENNLNPFLALGLIGAVLALPVITLSIPSGVLADRFDRRKLIMISMAGGLSASLWLAWLSHVHGSLIWMYACLLLYATSLALGWPARSALLPQIVPAEIFSNATMWNSSGFQLAAMVGPSLGGLILMWSVPLAYVICAACLATFGFLITFLTVRPATRRREPVSWSSLAAGVKFVLNNEIILSTITLDLFAVLLGGATALLPAFARDILHVGPRGFGLLRAAPAVGALTMAIVQAHRAPMRRAGLSMLTAVAGFGAAIIVFGLSRSFTLSFIALFVTGACDNISVIVRHTLVQLLTPEHMRGRVSAVNNIFIGASNQLGDLESGLVAAWLGPVRCVVAGGIGTILVVLTVAGVWPKTRKFGALDDARPIEDETTAA